MTSDRWSDLKARLLSSIVMVGLAVVAIWFGGFIFALFVTALVAAMHWELARMLSPLSRQAKWLSPIFAVLVLINLTGFILPPISFPLTILVGAALQAWFFMSYRFLGAFYSSLIILAGLILIFARLFYGVTPIIWILAVVVVTDIFGYFAGRLIGGPKFWPRISPKKTWSGVVAGWIGAVGVGVILSPFVTAYDINLIALCALGISVSFASQLGDIFESFIKRKSGVKDSSRLIPGHGGILDRMDGVITATIVFAIFSVVWL